MKRMLKSVSLLSATVLMLLAIFLWLRVPSMKAQQTQGAPGSPSARESLDTRQLPPPPPRFGGKINRNADQSAPWWPPRVVPPKGAPSTWLLIAMTDDVGFGAPSTLGVLSPRPTWTGSCEDGVTLPPISIPRRCARPHEQRLITERNHHSAGFGVISEQSTEFSQVTTASSPAIQRLSAKFLRANGYMTSWFGKDHNTPEFPGEPGQAT